MYVTIRFEGAALSGVASHFDPAGGVGKADGAAGDGAGTRTRDNCACALLVMAKNKMQRQAIRKEFNTLKRLSFSTTSISYVRIELVSVILVSV